MPAKPMTEREARAALKKAAPAAKVRVKGFRGGKVWAEIGYFKSRRNGDWMHIDIHLVRDSFESAVSNAIKAWRSVTKRGRK